MAEASSSSGSAPVNNIVKEGWLFKRGNFNSYCYRIKIELNKLQENISKTGDKDILYSKRMGNLLALGPSQHPKI